MDTDRIRQKFPQYRDLTDDALRRGFLRTGQYREFFPEYNDLSDGDLLLRIHQKYEPRTHIKDFLADVDPEDNARFTITDEMWPTWEAEVTKPRQGESGSETRQRTMGGDLREESSPLETAVQGGMQGLNFGGFDNLYGGVNSLVDYATGKYPGKALGELYQAHRGRMQGKLERARDDRPALAYGSEIAGAIANPVNYVTFGAPAYTFPGKVAAGMARGSAEGLVYGGLSGETVGDAVEGAAWGGTIGGAVPGVLGAFASRPAKEPAKQFVNRAPTQQALRQQASALFDQADNAPAMPRQQLGSAYPGVMQRMTQEGLDVPPAGISSNTPKTYRATQRMAEEAASPDPNMTFRDLDMVRKQASNAAQSMDRPDARLGAMLVDEVDDLVANLDPSLGETVDNARKIWGRLRRSEEVERIIREATGGAYKSGPDSGIRNGFRNLLRRIYRGRVKGYTPEEIKAMEAVVNRTPWGRVLAQVGRWGFATTGGSNALGGGLGAGAGATIGSALGGPVGAVAGAAATSAGTTLARRAAEKALLREADVVRAMVASGEVPQMLPPSALRQLLAQALKGAPAGVQPINPLQGRLMQR